MARFVLFIVVVAWTASADAQLRATGRYRLEDVREQCIILSQVKIGPRGSEHDAARCRVSSFVAFGAVGDTLYYRALYCLTPHWHAHAEHGGCDQHGSRALAIFVGARESDTAQLLLERATPDVGVLRYGEPAIDTNRDGTILHVNIAVDGTGVGNESEYYLLRDGAWHPIDAHGWLKDLGSQIPSGREIWKGVWPDLKTMTAQIALYQRGDANCCPTGGTLRVALEIRANSFVVRSLRYEP